MNFEFSESFSETQKAKLRPRTRTRASYWSNGNSYKGWAFHMPREFKGESRKLYCLKVTFMDSDSKEKFRRWASMKTQHHSH